MAGPWIDAASALKLVEGSSGETGGAQPLCARAHAGLVKTRARLLVHEERRAENVELPPTFWWAEGHEALEQNWPTGDFATWIDGKGEYRAFGVELDLDGVLGMLPFEERASVARRLSVAGNAAWMPARQASLLACKAPGVVSGSAAVLDHARLGFVTGRAVLAQGFADQNSSRLMWEEREWDVPASFWEDCMRRGEAYRNWQLGRFSAHFFKLGGARFVVLSGTYFLTESLQVLMPPAEPAPPVENVSADAPAKAAAGGRPPQPWWDDLWCALWGLIHQGGFTPKSQADVEKAMLTWAVMNGHEVSEAAVRPKARKLFRTLKGEVTNFLAG